MVAPCASRPTRPRASPRRGPALPSLSSRPDPDRRLVIAVVAAVLAVGALGAVAVATDTLGAGYAFGRVVARVNLFIDPPPDRATLPTVEITPRPSPSARPSPSPTPTPVSPSPGASPTPTPAPSPSPSPSPVREAVDFALDLDPDTVFAHQATKEWCAPAGVQYHARGSRPGRQLRGVPADHREPHRRVGEPTGQPRRRLGPSGDGPGSRGVRRPRYEVRAYRERDDVMRDAAVALSTTNSPVVLIPGSAPTPGS